MYTEEKNRIILFYHRNKPSGFMENTMNRGIKKHTLPNDKSLPETKEHHLSKVDLKTNSQAEGGPRGFAL